MKLKSEISLSKKHTKSFGVFPYFFAPTLNALHGVQKQYKLSKPKLETWVDEGMVTYRKGHTELNIQYAYPESIEIFFRYDGSKTTLDYQNMLTIKERKKEIDFQHIQRKIYDFLKKNIERIEANLNKASV
jgi:hypothetical protein